MVRVQDGAQARRTAGAETVTNKQIGARLRAFRVQRGITQTELAAAIGLSFQQVQKYEAGHSSITTARLPALCKMLAITPNDLYGDLFNGAGHPAPPLLSGPAIRSAVSLDELPTRLRTAVGGLINHLKDRRA